MRVSCDPQGDGAVNEPTDGDTESEARVDIVEISERCELHGIEGNEHAGVLNPDPGNRG